MKTPKNILKQHNLTPNKRLGQNFLTDKKVLAKIIQAADLLSTSDVVIEIGPGTGILTLELAKYAKKVIAVEKDRKIAEILKNILIENNIKNVEIIEGDILKIENSLCHSRPCFAKGYDEASESGNPDNKHSGSRIPRSEPRAGKCGMTNNKNYKIIANIPYYLTSPLIRKFLEFENQPEIMVLMIQKEVAQRICAQPPRMTLLSIATQFYAEPKIISYVSKKSFFPQPKIDSAIIKITPRNTPPFSLPLVRGGLGWGQFRDRFFKVVKAAFSQPRKQLVNNLSKGLNLTREQTEKILSQCGIKPTQRPSELSVDKYLELTWKTYGK